MAKFTVSVDWIMEFASYHGPRGNVWKRPQIEALGLKYPPKKGWVHAVAGKQISQDDRKNFEQYKDTSRKRRRKRKNRESNITAADWSGECENCGASPIVPATGLCGPCTFGESETIGGNW